MNPLYSIATALSGYVAIGAAILGGFVLILVVTFWAVGSKGLKRIFSPCKECQFTPSKATWRDPKDGSWHQIQECSRCGNKRDVVLPRITLESAKAWFFSNQP